jgi:hypothetical protein
MKTSTKIAKECEMIKDLLLEKNAKYGDSALTPIQVFSKLDAEEAICARIDDKMSRIKNSGINSDTEDTLNDLIGYLVLLKIARKGRITKNIKLDMQGVTC